MKKNTIFLTLGLVAVGGITLYLYNKKKKEKESAKGEKFSNATNVKITKMEGGECPAGCLMQRRQNRCVCSND